MRLYLIRHGQSANNAADEAGDRLARVPDPELTDIGHRQAQLLAEHLAAPEGDPLRHPKTTAETGRTGHGLTHIYCSLMTRSILTADYIARAFGLPLVADADIFENQGMYELAPDGSKTGVPGPGRPYFEERFPDLVLPETVGDSGWYDRPHETEDVFLDRTRKVARDMEARHGGTDDHVALVIHGDLIDQLLNEFTGVARRPENYETEWVANWAFHNTSVTRIDVNRGSRVVVYTNRAQHLPGDLITW